MTGILIAASAPLIGLWVSGAVERVRSQALLFAAWSLAQGALGILLWRYWR